MSGGSRDDADAAAAELDAAAAAAEDDTAATEAVIARERDPIAGWLVAPSVRCAFAAAAACAAG